MIKKILLTLFILIVIVVAGIITLVVFVDPNNFKGFISNTVKEKTGYELTIEGDLRWHIWPQISILTDSVRLVDSGASKPILTADNMRLDVELFPLFSKELVVKNVLVKAAIINITDDSKGNIASGNKPITTVNTTPVVTSDKETAASTWSFSLNKLDIADSTVIYQQDKNIINFRDINISVTQKDNKNVAVNLSGSVNRDQQDFIYALNADVDLANFPKTAQVDLKKLTYDYKGVGVPLGELKGEVKATFNYQQSPLTLNSKDFSLTLNDNKITGQLKADLNKKPYFEALFTADKFDLTPFLASSADQKNNDINQSSQTVPVVVSKNTKGNELEFLQAFDAKFNFTVNELIANKLIINNFIVDAVNKEGIATLSKISLDAANGHIQAEGIANGKQPTMAIKLSTKVSDIDLGVLLEQLALTNNFKGQFNADGQIATDTINSDKIINALTGNLAVKINNARFDNLNIQHIIQNAIAQYSKESITESEYQKYTELQEISANAQLGGGNANLSSIKALSATLDVTGDGLIRLSQRDLDINLQVKILGGWNGDSKTIQKLQKIAIPLQFYGSFDELHYKVLAEKLIKDVLNNKLNNELDRLKERLSGNNKDNTKNQTESPDESNDNTKAKDIIGGLLNKIK
ncbi:outer membrane assembly protein AsmA [Orbus sturtevantii]|uniref:outer membrane assembly protein AsmA n=1 Tax=Orbus sturtevantii TaxID=3074109 RepID=UPI00370DC457